MSKCLFLTFEVEKNFMKEELDWNDAQKVRNRVDDAWNDIDKLKIKEQLWELLLHSSFRDMEVAFVQFSLFRLYIVYGLDL